ncbi:hypothetical protein QFC22_006553 [Naganishia vaughanmartiniae]|uniref:Uncharacterized protein n=1 Tax=Naganishia vaughanmartiniae TaxID=1424756 RepID=A0ACC2WIF1_9TREE|nr:hypothetical protein QFC22_006553 [Naganishia vaughanmartiniae]
MLRIDFLILPILTIAYGLQYYDKAVLGSATLFGILRDLDLTTARYSQANAFFYYAYAVAAFPMAILCQRFGKHLNIFLGTMVVLWGVIVMLTPVVKDWRGLYAQRFFLGQVANSPVKAFLFALHRSVGITRVRSDYKTLVHETRDANQNRYLVFVYHGYSSATGLFSIFSGLVNRRLGAVHTSLAPWKLIFLVPGAITVIFGAFLLLFLPPSPLQHPIVSIPGYNKLPAHILQETHEKVRLDGNPAVRGEGDDGRPAEAKWDWSQAREAVVDVKIWGFFLMATAIYVVNGSVTVFGPLLVKSIGYTSLQATLLLTPGGATTCISIYIFALLASSRRIARTIPFSRTILLVLSCLPPIIGAVMCWKAGWENKAVPLAGYYLLPTFGAPFVLLLGWSTANVQGGTKQAISSAAIFLGYNLGNIAASYILLPSEAKHHYPTTFKTVIGVMCATIGVTLIISLFMARENKRRDAEQFASVGARRDVRVTDVENEKEAVDLGIAREEEEARDVSDGQNRSFRYIL